MKILIYSEITAESLQQNLGLSEYSYYFVLREFRPLLAKIGEVVLIENPWQQADAIFDDCQTRGEQCVLLAFSPPHKTPVALRCPTVCVFAWEFDSLPNEGWDNNPANDWGKVLLQLGCAITHSRFMVDTVHAALGARFPIVTIPAPVWDRHAAQASSTAWSLAEVANLALTGTVVDTRCFDLAPYNPRPVNTAEDVAAATATRVSLATEFTAESRGRLALTWQHCMAWYREVLADVLPLWLTQAIDKLDTAVAGPVPVADTADDAIALFPPLPCGDFQLQLSGVVYTSVFNPYDGRKNWFDMVCAFCWAFRDTEDATLVLKLTHFDIEIAAAAILETLYKSSPFKCRVVIIHSFLSEADYQQLIKATTYVVNTSHGEGQCLPLMEYMSSGKPAIAPRNTALGDYIDEQVAFVVDSTPEPTHWPHDPRHAYRTLRYRINWASLLSAYRASYDVAVTQPQRYLQMSECAVARLRQHCSEAALKTQLEQFLTQAATRSLQGEAVC